MSKHFTFTYPLRAFVAQRAFTELYHSSRLVAAVRTSSHDLQPASCLSFSTVRLNICYLALCSCLDEALGLSSLSDFITINLFVVNHELFVERHLSKTPFQSISL